MMIVAPYDFPIALFGLSPSNIQKTWVFSIENRLRKIRQVSTAQQFPLHVQKGINFLCKNRLKIGRSNYIKNLAEKSCFFKAHRRLSLKIYAKESSLYGAISCVLHFMQAPRQSLRFTQFLLLSESVWSEIACKKYAPYSFRCFY